MKQPLIAIPGKLSPEAVGHRTPVVSCGQNYIDAVHRAGGLPIIVSPTNDRDVIASTLTRCDGMLMIGGGDVSPTKYGATEWARLSGVNEFLDDFEIAACNRAIETEMPILAVCRGQQVLNVALGGTLIQHLKTTPDHRDTMHGIQVVPGSRLALAMGTTDPFIHSLHHQAIENLASDLAVVGTHQDGTIEAVEHKGSTWIVGVQWHPEDTARDDPSQQGLFNTLISHAR
jgi:putative glutamine amidotransferase